MAGGEFVVDDDASVRPLIPLRGYVLSREEFKPRVTGSPHSAHTDTRRARLICVWNHPPLNSQTQSNTPAIPKHDRKV
jgi:hypothetical protein